MRVSRRLRRIRAGVSAVAGGLDGAADRGWQWDEDGFVALAADAQHPVAVLLAEVGDVRPTGFEDPQPEQAEHGDQCEVVAVGREPGCGQQRLELQVR